MKHLRMRSRGALIAAVLLVALALVLAACGSNSSSSSSSSTTAGTPVAGGTYNFPLGSEPISIEPLNTQESEGAQVEHQCFQGLYKIAEDGSVQPDIADGQPTVNSDATEFTYKIKHGVMFGPPVNREVTAQDFVDSWNYNADAANKSATTYIMDPIQGIDPDTGYAGKGGLTGVTALDKYTLQVKLRYPFAEFNATLVHPITHVFPVDYAQKVGRKAYFNKPVGGTGPYMVKNWKHNQSITLVKNPDYWDKANAAYIDTLNMPIIMDVSTEWLDFQKGTLDYSNVPVGQVRAAQNMSQVKSGEWTAKMYPSTTVYFISVVMNKPLLGADSMLPIRQALNYGADRVDVCNVVTEGVNIPSDEIVPVTIPGYQPGMNPYPYNPDKGKAAVQQWISANGGKQPPTLPYSYNTGSNHDKIAAALVAGWNNLGLQFKLSGLETNAYWTAAGENKLNGLVRMGWIADYPSIDNFIYLFTTAGGKYGSYSFYSNKKVDQMFQQARSTTDQTQRWNLYNQAQKLFLTDAPCVPVYTYRDFRVTNNRIAGFNYSSFMFIDMNKLWVKQ